MSYIDGMAALNLEMPDRVPRTEYSAHRHWELLNNVLGTSISEQSSKEEQQRASNDFVKAWNYDFMWMTLIHRQVFKGKSSSMGHAVYEQGGVDLNKNTHNLFEDPEEALNFDPWEMYGKIDTAQAIKDFDVHIDGMNKNYDDLVNTTGIYVTCLSGLIEIFGWETLLMATGIDSNKFGEVTNRYVSWIMQYFEALANSKVPVVMIHDDIVWTEGAIFHPEWYRKYIFPNHKKLIAPLIEAGKKVIYTSDGDYTEFIDDIVGCGAHGFVMEPMTDMKYIAEKYGKTHSFIGNVDTRILLMGTKEDIYNEVKRCMDIGKKCPGFFMAVGNHIPANTPIDNALYYNEIYEKLSKR